MNFGRGLATVGVALAASLAFSQCERSQSYGVESVVVFKLSAKTELRIFGVAGHAYSQTASGATLAHLGRSFAPDRFEIVTDGTDSPSGRMAIVMKRVRALNPCANPLFNTTTSGTAANWNIANFSGGVYSWSTSPTAQALTSMSQLNASPGEWVIIVGFTDSSGLIINNAIQTYGYFYSADDSDYGSNPLQLPGNDDWGSVVKEVPDGGSGGASAEEIDTALDEQNVNQENFWVSLFVPSEEKWNEWLSTLQNFFNYTPLGLFFYWNDYVQTYLAAAGDPDYLLQIPTPFGQMEIDLSPWTTYLRFLRFLWSVFLWSIVINRLFKFIMESKK